MCGISLDLLFCTSPHDTSSYDLFLNAVSLSSCNTLRTRGPDSQCSTRISLHENHSAFYHTDEDKQPSATASTSAPQHHVSVTGLFTATVLHLRGSPTSVTVQPLQSDSGNMLDWNGEVWSVNQEMIKLYSKQVLGFPSSDLPQLLPKQNDTQFVLSALTHLEETDVTITIPLFLSCIEGPFSIIYYHRRSGIIFYARDRFGRRSLLASHSSRPFHPEQSPSISVLHSVRLSSVRLSPLNPSQSENEVWEEINPSGIYFIRVNTAAVSDQVPFSVQHVPHLRWVHTHLAALSDSAHPSSSSSSSSSPLPSATLSYSLSQSSAPTAASLAELDGDEDSYAPVLELSSDAGVHQYLSSDLIENISSKLPITSSYMSSLSSPAKLFYSVLRQSVAKRVLSLCMPSSSTNARVGVLFSGGIDCMVLAYLVHELLPPDEPIDLINVAFVGELKDEAADHYIPDRIAAIKGWKELKKCSQRLSSSDASSSSSSSSITPLARHWNLIKVNISHMMLKHYRDKINSLLSPKQTIMDFNIGSVLFFGAKAIGRLHIDSTQIHGTSNENAVPANGKYDRIENRLRRIAGNSQQQPSSDLSSSSSNTAPPSSSSSIHTSQLQNLSLSNRDTIKSASSSPSNNESDSVHNGNSIDAHSTPHDDIGAGDNSDETGEQLSDVKEKNKLSKQEKRAEYRKLKNKKNKELKKQQNEKLAAEKQDCIPTLDDFYSIEEQQTLFDMYINAAVQASKSAPSLSSISTTSSPSSSSSSLYSSPCKVLLLGIGADEQLGGYTRHRAIFQHAGEGPLRNELQKDFNRLWWRNNGRDDRMISDAGKECRQPFLDEDFVELVQRKLPLSCICDLSLPAGVGDKKILREVGRGMGLIDSSKLVKRAMQFGTRMANKNVDGFVMADAKVDLKDIIFPPFIKENLVNMMKMSPESIRNDRHKKRENKLKAIQSQSQAPPPSASASSSSV